MGEAFHGCRVDGGILESVKQTHIMTPYKKKRVLGIPGKKTWKNDGFFFISPKNIWVKTDLLEIMKVEVAGNPMVLGGLLYHGQST